MALSALVHVRGRFGAFLLHLLTALSNCGEHSTGGRRSTLQDSRMYISTAFGVAGPGTRLDTIQGIQILCSGGISWPAAVQIYSVHCSVSFPSEPPAPWQGLAFCWVKRLATLSH